MTTLLFCLAAVVGAAAGEDAFEAGWHAEQQNQDAQALAFYAQAAQQSTELAPFAQIQHARTLLRMSQAAAAEQELRQVLRQYPEGPWIRMAQAYLGRLLMSQAKNEEAVALLRDATNVRPHPWWMEEFAAETAELMARTPAASAEAMAYYRQVVLDTIYIDKRIRASRMLLSSPSFDDRAVAVNGLLRSNAVTESGVALLANTASLLAAQGGTLPPEVSLILSSATATDAQLLQAHDTLVTTGMGEAWVRLWLAFSARKAQDPQALGVAHLLAAKYPDSLEAGDTLWWLGNRSKESNPALAIIAYQRLAQGCQKHSRADDAYFEAARLLAAAGQKAEAEKMLLDLAKNFPASRFRAEGLYDAAAMELRNNNVEKARELFAASAGNKVGDFYAHRALDRLSGLNVSSLDGAANLRVDGLRSVLRAFPVEITPPRPLPSFLENSARVRRMIFFGRHGIDCGEWEALDLLLQMRRELNPSIYYRIIAEAGYGHSALQFAQAREWGLKESTPTIDRLRLEYPLAYWPQVQAISRETGVDPYLILAVAKQESTFRAGIQSHAGATGVMQLMPGTASWLAKIDSNIGPETVANLKSPENSIRLGAYYLMRMVERSGRNLIYATASYNAGPGNNDKWVKRFPGYGVDEYIEAIPFEETKNYVKRVLGNYAAYRTLYPEAQQMAAR